MAKQLDHRSIGLRIKTLRLQQGVYQTELAKQIGVSQTHMSNIESGRAGLTLENLVKMSEIFDCSLDEIVFGVKQQEDALPDCTMEDVLQAMQMLKAIRK